MLHPRHKLAYFKKAGWEPQWIEEAESIVRNEFERSYSTGSVEEEIEAEPKVSDNHTCFI